MITFKKKFFIKKTWIKPTIIQEKMSINLFFTSRNRSRMNEVNGILLASVSCATCNAGKGCVSCPE